MATLPSDIVPNGMSQGALVAFLQNVVTLVNEMRGDLNAVRADLSALHTKYNAALAKLDADAGVTDTNYVATQAAPALTSTDVATAALKLTKG